jgi:hypothetical protein
MLMLLIVLLILSVALGGVWHTKWNGGYVSWSPLGVILLIFVILWLTGNLGSLHCSHWR